MLADIRQGTMTPIPERSSQATRPHASWIVRAIVGVGLMYALLFAAAGTTSWPRGWLFVGVITPLWCAIGAYLWVVNPAVIVARSRLHKDTKSWDKVWLGFYAVTVTTSLGLAAADSGRALWLPVPDTWIAAGYVLTLIGFGLVAWAEGVNEFFEVSVRIQHERGHRVIDTGPYAFIRHPGYLGGILGVVGLPLALGSWIGAGVGLVVACELVLRTWLEDRTLRAELAGYLEYCARTRYRLVPGVW